MRFLLLMALMGVVAGCGSAGHKGYAKPGADYSDFYNDLVECEQENTRESSWCWGRQCNIQRNKAIKRRNQCLRARGWKKANSGGGFVP